MYVHLSNGCMYDKQRQLYIKFDPALPSPQNRIQCYICDVKISEMKDLPMGELTMLMTEAKKYPTNPHVNQRTGLSVLRYSKMQQRIRWKEVKKHMHDTIAQYYYFSRHICPDMTFRQYAEKYHYNQWYILYKK